ncbi:MAG: carboxypeptidase-like regulatory domain-containing protein [Chloroflexia bacterium]|nr:carboxypeptidase-like regulatory domain-containing protein [Chloroflexia bacterium]
MKKYISILIVSLLMNYYYLSFGQAPAIAKIIKGQIVDSETSHAVEYATIAVFTKQTKELVTGAITGPDGHFTVKGINEGNYYLEISFMGYEKQ